MESGKNLMLPLSHEDSKQKEERQRKVSAMTKKGVFVALSYMASSGILGGCGAYFVEYIVLAFVKMRRFLGSSTMCWLLSDPISGSVLLVMFNKAALSSYNFPFANVITLSQMVFAFMILYVMKSLKVISFTTSESLSGSSNSAVFVSYRTLAQTLPLALTYLLFMIVTMEAVRGINIPMYTTLRRTVVAFTMVMEYFLSGQIHSRVVVGSVGIIIAGAFVAGARDITFDSYSYSVVFIENMCKAVYLASVSRLGKSSGLNIFGIVWCNVVICGPILFLWSLLRGDLQTTLNFPYFFYPGFQVVMFLSCAFTFFINYIVVLNTTINSALTQAICGNLKDVFTSGFGWLLFGGLPYDLFNILGQVLGFLGSCLYAYCKLQGK